MLLWENSDQIHNLFSPDVQYQIPRYQRRYVWDQTNWHTLWEDILLQGKLEFENRGHFTGNIVTRPITGGPLSRYEVIDGQQRLATFQIILCIIRDICLSQDSDELKELADEVSALIVNSPPVIRRSTSDRFPDPTYKFSPTDYDKSAFQKITKGEYGEPISQAFNEEENRLQPELVKEVRSQLLNEFKEGGNSILDAYDYFYVQIRTYVGADYDCDKVSDLITSIKYDFYVIHITLGSSDQPEKIFESLNATGRMLSEFDYLRNNLFLRAGKLGKDENGRSYSNIFYDKYWIFENDSQYWSADRLDAFFRAFLMAELGPESEGKTLKAFDRYRNYSKTLTESQKQSVEHELDQLKHYADSYREMSDPNSDIGCRMQFYDNLDLPRLDSFILFLKHKLRLRAELLHDVCCILESYIVQRLLCANRNEASDTRINSYEKANTFFSKSTALGDNLLLFKTGSKAIKGNTFDVDAFVADLCGTWPNDDQVRTALEQAWLKDHNLILYILYRIELHKHECDAGTYQPLDFKDLKSLLRIMRPRDLPNLLAADSIGNIMPTTRDSVTHLLDAGLEEIKRSFPEIAGDLILSREICTWNIDPTGQEYTEKINNRAQDLIDSFSLIWPPASSH